MTRTKTQALTQIALLVALSLVLGKVFQFSLPVGYFTLLDVGLYAAAFYLGKKEGALVGALSGFLIDLISGYPQYMLVSLVAHGGQGYLAGFKGTKRPLGLVLATIVMVGTYYLAEIVFVANVVTPLAAIPGNVIQSLLGLVLGGLVAGVMRKVLR